MSDLIFIIIGMAAVTYIPRLIPFYMLAGVKVPKKIDNFLRCIPAAAIGALIIPGVFNATPEIPMAAMTGILFALLFGLLRGGIIIPVLGSVAVTYLFMIFAP